MKSNIYSKIAAAALLFAGASAHAQTTKIIHFSTGTGFFVNDAGYLLTNNHVIEKCRKYAVYGQDATMQATLVAKDSDHDLALLKTSFAVAEIGTFSEQMEGLSKEDPLVVIGYPGKAWEKRQPVVRTAKVMDLQGPQGEDSLLQFSESVAQGNSGGPLLDASGNVVGVIVAKSTMMKINRLTRETMEVKRSDVAINLKTVWGFLDKARINYHKALPASALTQSEIISKAKRFIVNVRCVVE